MHWWFRWCGLPLLALLCSCGPISLQSGFQGSDVTERGQVSFVQFTSVSDGRGSLIKVTIVTLSQPPGIGREFIFCGNLPGRFPVNALVTTRFRPGTPCASVVSVFIEQRG
jgi:hypothetical protein